MQSMRVGRALVWLLFLHACSSGSNSGSDLVDDTLRPDQVRGETATPGPDLSLSDTRTELPELPGFEVLADAAGSEVEDSTSADSEPGDSVPEDTWIEPPEPEVIEGPGPVELRLFPSLAFVGTETVVRFQARIADVSTAPEFVRLEVRDDGEDSWQLFELVADHPENSPAQGRDGLYELELALDTAEPGSSVFRIVAQTGEEELVTEPAVFSVLEILPEGWVDQVWDSAEPVVNMLREELPLSGRDEALARATERLRGAAGVLEANWSPDTGAITAVMVPGVIVMITTNGEDLRSGGDDPVGPPEAIPVEIGDRKGLLLRLWGFRDDETASIKAVADATSECRPLLDMRRKDHEYPMLDFFFHLSDFALVHIQSHGTTVGSLSRFTWQHGLCEAMGFQIGTPGCDAVVLLLGNRTWKDQDALIVYDGLQRGDSLPPARVEDLLTGRLGLMFSTVRDPEVPDNSGLHYLVLGDFIEHYNVPFPNTIVFGAFCDSLHYGTIARAFLRRGAGAYLGFSYSVDSRFAKRMAEEFFTCLLSEPGRTVGDCFIPGQAAPANSVHWSQFLMMGNPSVRLSPPDLGNGGFEGDYHLRTLKVNVNPVQGYRAGFWESNGTLRVVESYGVHEPTEGSHFAMAGNFGPGNTGNFSQEFCLPPGAQTVILDHAIYTNDCRPGTADLVKGLLIVDDPSTGSAEEVLLFNHNLQIQAACSNLTWDIIEELTYSDGTYPRATPWMSAEADVSAFTGGDSCVPARISFTAFDRTYNPPSSFSPGGVGDTAVLIDNIRVLGGEQCTQQEPSFLDGATGAACPIESSLGQVPGARVCLTGGAPHCAGVALVPEVCDHVDNDGDGYEMGEEYCTDVVTCDPSCTGPNCACDDHNPCTSEVCTGEQECRFTLLTGPSCDDKNDCTGNDRCLLGTCIGEPVEASCDDDRICTTDDKCVDGWCVGTVQFNAECDDDRFCTEDDRCTSYGGCRGAPIQGPCVDEYPCTIDEFCNNGYCDRAGYLQCDDLNDCTKDYCKWTTGCVFEPIEGCGG